MRSRIAAELLLRFTWLAEGPKDTIDAVSWSKWWRYTKGIQLLQNIGKGPTNRRSKHVINNSKESNKASSRSPCARMVNNSTLSGLSMKTVHARPHSGGIGEDRIVLVDAALRNRCDIESSAQD